MSQHFLLSSAARSLSLATVARMSDEEAWNAFRAIRWSDTQGEPVCPRCGCLDSYTYKTRRVFRCRGCSHQFTVTSGTIFASRKMPIRDYLLAIAIFVNGAKGHSALQLSRDLDCQYKSAYVLAMKLREAIGAETDGQQASGQVEIDGGYFGGYVKPANLKEHRRDRRLFRNQNGKRQVVVVVRERGGNSVPAVFKSEAKAMAFLRAHVAKGTILNADEAGSWEELHKRYEVKRINHQEAYSLDGACTNWAEEFFSRMRRAEIGHHHHIAGAYLLRYAQEASWREDNRRASNGDQVNRLAGLAMKQKPSVDFSGYWQRHQPECAS
jgi:transposase-like protein